jgi:hypothetical protein
MEYRDDTRRVATRRLSGYDLDYMVAITESKAIQYGGHTVYVVNELTLSEQWSPSTNWRQGSPIMRKYGIRMEQVTARDGKTSYTAKILNANGTTSRCAGRSALEAAMRVVVLVNHGESSRLPPTVD